jgi:hypothetical protein
VITTDVGVCPRRSITARPDVVPAQDGNVSRLRYGYYQDDLERGFRASDFRQIASPMKLPR